MRDVIADPDGEVVEGLYRGELAEHGCDVAWSEVLRGETVTAADDDGNVAPRLAQSGHHVEVEGLADGSRLLRAVEHRQRAHGRRQGGRKGGDRERSEQPHLEDADLF